MKKQNCIKWIQTLSFYAQKHYIFKVIAENVETRFDTSNYELDIPLPKGKNNSNRSNER